MVKPGEVYIRKAIQLVYGEMLSSNEKHENPIDDAVSEVSKRKFLNEKTGTKVKETGFFGKKITVIAGQTKTSFSPEEVKRIAASQLSVAKYLEAKSYFDGRRAEYLSPVLLTDEEKNAVFDKRSKFESITDQYGDKDAVSSIYDNAETFRKFSDDLEAFFQSHEALLSDKGRNAHAINGIARELGRNLTLEEEALLETIIDVKGSADFSSRELSTIFDYTDLTIALFDKHFKDLPAEKDKSDEYTRFMAELTQAVDDQYHDLPAPVTEDDDLSDDDDVFFDALDTDPRTRTEPAAGSADDLQFDDDVGEAAAPAPKTSDGIDDSGVASMEDDSEIQGDMLKDFDMTVKVPLFRNIIATELRVGDRSGRLTDKILDLIFSPDNRPINCTLEKDEGPQSSEREHKFTIDFQSPMTKTITKVTGKKGYKLAKGATLELPLRLSGTVTVEGEVTEIMLDKECQLDTSAKIGYGFLSKTFTAKLIGFKLYEANQESFVLIQTADKGSIAWSSAEFRDTFEHIQTDYIE